MGRTGGNGGLSLITFLTRANFASVRDQTLDGHVEVEAFLGDIGYALGELVMIAEDSAEIGFVEDEEVAAGDGADVGGSRGGHEDGDLAEDVAVLEGFDDAAGVVEHFDLA